ncbi:MAG TPA: hypothetical protein VGE29_07635, partial [Prosthecobacter sp.]
SAMTGLLELRILDQHEDFDPLRPVRLAMIECCSHLMNHLDIYDLDPAIYGDLRPRLQKLLHKLEIEESP